MLFAKIVTLLLYLHTSNVLTQAADSPDSHDVNYTRSASGFLSSLAHDCQDPSVECFQRSAYKYLTDLLKAKDVEVNQYIKFTKNNVLYNTTDNFIEGRSIPTDQISRALNEQTSKFMYTHDLEVAIPEFLDGGILKISPRASGDDAMTLKVNMVADKSTPGTPRILFKKIKKFISNKLLMALFAIVLVIKLLVMKLMFFLPTVIGVAAAKKLLLKVILFVFPVVGHLFKLCPYYKPTKYHHHHHQIQHLHKLPHFHGGPNIEIEHVPHEWNDYNQHHDELEYYRDGPSFDFSTHRKTYESGKLVRRDENAPYNENGQGQFGVGHHGHESKPVKQRTGPLTSTEIENMVLKAEKEAILKARLQEEQKRVESENKRLQDQIKTAMKLQEKLKFQASVAKQTQKIAAAYQPTTSIIPQPFIQPQIIHTLQTTPIQSHYVASSHMAHSQPITHTQAIYHQGLANAVTFTTTKAPSILPHFDSFYSPILEKIDKIFVELSYFDESCRERLICSMYKNPTKFSPHSNLISVELSRDPSELPKPANNNAAVIRFYKYVQAARDGQDKRDCLRLYPSCSVITE